MNEVFLSIIVPVYNCEPYVARCIESVLKLNYSDWELLLINDGSTDKSESVCRDYAQRDSRISVFSKSNGGPSSARNLGLEKAKGEWVVFVDSDDWVDCNLMDVLIEGNGNDLIYFGYKEILENKILNHQIADSSYKVPDIDYELNALFESKDLFFGFTVNKFFKRKIIKFYDLRFDESLYIKEDEEFTLRYCNKIASLFISDKTPYNYRILNTSLSHKKRFSNLFLLALKLEYDLKDCPWPVLRMSIIKRVYYYYLYALYEARNSCELKKYINYWIEYFIRFRADLRLKDRYSYVHKFMPKSFRTYLIRMLFLCSK